MSTLTFQVSDEQATRLTAAAQDKGVQVEELLRQIADDFLTRQEAVDAAAGYVLRKNAELYRRLAK